MPHSFLPPYIVRLQQAFRKLFFCLKVSGDISTFLTLAKETKKRQRESHSANQETMQVYRLNVTGKYTDIYLRTHSGDIGMLYEIFLYRSYSFKEMDLFYPKTIVDLGAHIGMSALYFQSKYPEATVYCIEPDRDNFELLIKNTSGSPHIRVLPAAVSDTDGSAVMAKSRYGYNSVVLTGTATGRPTRTITLATLFSELKISTIDLLKIDIEGHEKNIFSGNTECLKNVDRIIIEVHSSEDETICRQALTQHSFSIVKLNNISDTVLYAVKKGVKRP